MNTASNSLWYIPLVNTTIFGFRVVVLSGAEEYLEGDAFIPEWSQKSPNADFQFEAEKANHFMEANQENIRKRFDEIMSDRVRRGRFYIEERR